MIYKPDLKKMTVSEIEREIKRLTSAVVQMIGSHYPNIIGGELAQLEAELARKLPEKIVDVSWDQQSNRGYVWKLGNRRVHPYRADHDGASLPSADLAAFFKRYKITKIRSKFGESETSPECIKDGTYSVKTYIEWWKQSEEDDES